MMMKKKIIVHAVSEFMKLKYDLLRYIVHFTDLIHSILKLTRQSNDKICNFNEQHKFRQRKVCAFFPHRTYVNFNNTLCNRVNFWWITIGKPLKYPKCTGILSNLLAIYMGANMFYKLKYTAGDLNSNITCIKNRQSCRWWWLNILWGQKNPCRCKGDASHAKAEIVQKKNKMNANTPILMKWLID